MADVITRFKVETAEYDRKIGQSKRKLDEFSQGGKSAGNVLKDFSSKMGLSVGSLTAMTGAVAAATAALKVGTDAFMSSESNIDEWGRTVESAKGAYDVFLQTINNGNWSSFFTNLNDAIRGSRELYDSLDRLGSVKANNQAAIALTQQNIQQLRLRKQNGENVDGELKAATDRLAKLQRQEVEAGIDAGTKQMVTTLKNAGISEAMAKSAADEIAKGGQNVFDKYAQMVKDLEAAGTGKGQAVSKFFGLVNYYEEGTFNEANLNEEQRKMYALAKAITERETTLQQGIATYAQAVQQGTASAREEFKNTKYGLNGGGGGKGGDLPPAVGSMDEIKKKITDLNKQLGAAVTEESRQNILALTEEAEQRLKGMQAATKGSGIDLRSVGKTSGNYLGIYKPEQKKEQKVIGTQGIHDQLSNAAAKIDTKGIEKQAQELQKLAKAAEVAQQNAAGAANAFSAIGSALSAIEDPAAKVMGILAMAIANMAGTFAKSLEGTFTPWDWIAGAAAGTATLISSITAIQNATSRYANGGEIKGNSYSGDNLLMPMVGGGAVAVNAGEYVFNRAQMGNLAAQLRGGSEHRMQEIRVKIENDQLVGTLRNANSRASYHA